MFKSMTGTRITHVPYNGSGVALGAVVSGETQMMFAPLGTSQPFARAGKLKILGVAGGQRSSLMPDLPTIAEAGVPGYEAGTWYGVVAPASTPQAIIGILDAEIVLALQQPDLRDKLNVLGYEPTPSRPGEFGAFIKAEISKWAIAIKQAGIVFN